MIRKMRKIDIFVVLFCLFIILTNHQMSTTTLVNVKKPFLIKAGYKDFQDWSKDPNHVYIGRDMSFYVAGAKGSKWGNPFKVKKLGATKCLELYEEYVRNNKELMDHLGELEGKVLGCWCVTAENDQCHGKVLIKLLNEKKMKPKNGKNEK